MLGIKPRALHMLGEHSASELNPQSILNPRNVPWSLLSLAIGLILYFERNITSSASPL